MASQSSSPSLASERDYLAKLQLYIHPVARLLICYREECRCALSAAGSRATTHLRDKHHVPSSARKGLTKVLRSCSLSEPDGASPREDGSPEHQLLRTHDGFACGGCLFRTVSLQSMKRHFSDSMVRESCRHYGQVRRSSDLDELFEYVYLQSWVGGPGRQYWIVQRDGSRLRAIGGQQVQDHLSSIRQRERERERRRTGIEDPGVTASTQYDRQHSRSSPEPIQNLTTRLPATS